MSAVIVALQATQALLQRLQQPSPATVEAEYDNIQKLDTFHTAKAPAPGCRLTALPLSQQQYATLMWQWCGVAKQLLGLLADPASAQSPSAVLVAGNLLSVLAVSLEMWIGATAGEVAQAALKQQIAQHTSGTGLYSRCGRMCSMMLCPGGGGVTAGSMCVLLRAASAQFYVSSSVPVNFSLQGPGSLRRCRLVTITVTWCGTA